jgi:hypothetical protein
VLQEGVGDVVWIKELSEVRKLAGRWGPFAEAVQGKEARRHKSRVAQTSQTSIAGCLLIVKIILQVTLSNVKELTQRTLSSQSSQRRETQDPRSEIERGAPGAPDGLGFSEYNSQVGVYIEVLSFEKVVTDAERWSAKHFEQLIRLEPKTNQRVDD